MLAKTFQQGLPANDTGPIADHRGFAWIGYVAIVVCFGGFGAWAALAPIDSAAIAQAKIAVESDRKPIQHLEGGIVREILVKGSQRVEQGQILFRLEPVKAKASAEILEKQIDAAMAQEARLLAESRRDQLVTFPDSLIARSNVPETAMAIAGQRSQFAERRATLRDQVSIFKAKIDQTTREIGGRKARLVSLKAQHANLDAELAKLKPLMARGLTTNTRILPLERERLRIEGDMGLTEAELARFDEIIAESRLQIRLAEQRFREEAVQQIGEVRARLSDLKDKLSVARDVLTRVEVRAPRTGIVHNVEVQGIGEVVKPGDTLAEIVPEGDMLILTAQVSPMDIDSVHAGLSANIQFPGLSRRETPNITGTVQRISADILIDETTKQPFYSARVIIDESTLPERIAHKLVPGMPATVLIKRGERTLIDYLISPLRDSISMTLRED